MKAFALSVFKFSVNETQRTDLKELPDQRSKGYCRDIQTKKVEGFCATQCKQVYLPESITGTTVPIALCHPHVTDESVIQNMIIRLEWDALICGRLLISGLKGMTECSQRCEPDDSVKDDFRGHLDKHKVKNPSREDERMGVEAFLLLIELGYQNANTGLFQKPGIWEWQQNGRTTGRLEIADGHHSVAGIWNTIRRKDRNDFLQQLDRELEVKRVSDWVKELDNSQTDKTGLVQDCNEAKRVAKIIMFTDKTTMQDLLEQAKIWLQTKFENLQAEYISATNDTQQRAILQKIAVLGEARQFVLGQQPQQPPQVVPPPQLQPQPLQPEWNHNFGPHI